MNMDSWQQLGNWLDGGPEFSPVSTHGRQALTHEDSNQPASQQALEMGAFLVIHGILLEQSRFRPEADRARIHAVMQKILAEPSEVSSDNELPSVPVDQINYFKSAYDLAWSAIAALFSCILIGGFLFLYLSDNASAASALERLIQLSIVQPDRTYEINVVAYYDGQRLPRNLRDFPPRTPKENMDGATLYLRGADQFVLIQNAPEDETRLVGSDGNESWAIKETGPVQISSDLARFRGLIPGSQQELPFINIQDHLEQLRFGYEIRIHSGTRTGKDSVLTGTRKSKDVCGPKEIRIEYDRETGVIERLFLEGLPRRGGGPRSVSVELVDQQPLGPEFFTRAFHHNPEREIKRVEARQ